MGTRLAAAAPKPKTADDDEETGGRSIHVGGPLLPYAGEKL